MQELQEGTNGLQPLKDVSKSGKDRHWKERKVSNRQLAEQLYQCWVMDMANIGYDENDLPPYDPQDPDFYWFKKSINAVGCADVLTFRKLHDGRLKLHQAWFCKDRLCPICNWRRAMKFSTQVGLILNEFKRRNVKGRPIFATFTMQNVKADEIGDSFSHFARSFIKLRQYKEVTGSLVGGIRASEITYNSDRDDYNTHIHCLMWMKPRYFTADYIPQERWTELWKRAAKLNYEPVVNIKAVKPKKPTESDPTGLFSAVLEVSKYPVKPNAFQKLVVPKVYETEIQKHARLKRIQALENGLYRKRLVSFFGLFKTVRAELALDDPEDGDLVNTDNDDESEPETEEVVVAKWDNYYREYYTHTENVVIDNNHDWHGK